MCIMFARLEIVRIDLSLLHCCSSSSITACLLDRRGFPHLLLRMSCQTSGYQYNESKRKLQRSPDRDGRLYAAVISIFLPLTLFHSKQTAPRTLNTDVATAT